MTSFNTEAIGARIKAERELQGLSMANLASVSGITSSTITRIENGCECMSETLWRIANALGVTPDYLIGYDESKKVSELRRLLRRYRHKLNSKKAAVQKMKDRVGAMIEKVGLNA